MLERRLRLIASRMRHGKLRSEGVFMLQIVSLYEISFAALENMLKAVQHL